MTMIMRQTTYVRRLKVGDRIDDDGKIWTVTRSPEVQGDKVVLYLHPGGDGKRSRAYLFGVNDRVRLTQ